MLNENGERIPVPFTRDPDGTLRILVEAATLSPVILFLS